MFYPIWSFLFGVPISFDNLIKQATDTPIPYPLALFSPDQGTMAVFQFVSLLVTILGGLITMGFALKTDQANKNKEQNAKIDKLDEKIDEAAIAVSQELKEFRREIQEMEKRICSSVQGQQNNIKEDINNKLSNFQKFEDERINNIRSELRRLGGDKEW